MNQSLSTTYGFELVKHLVHDDFSITVVGTRTHGLVTLTASPGGDDFIQYGRTLRQLDITLREELEWIVDMITWLGEEVW